MASSIGDRCCSPGGADALAALQTGRVDYLVCDSGPMQACANQNQSVPCEVMIRQTTSGMDQGATRIGYPAAEQQRRPNFRELVCVGPARAKHRLPHDKIQRKQRSLETAWECQLQH